MDSLAYAGTPDAHHSTPSARRGSGSSDPSINALVDHGRRLETIQRMEEQESALCGTIKDSAHRLLAAVASLQTLDDVDAARHEARSAVRDLTALAALLQTRFRLSGQSGPYHVTASAITGPEGTVCVMDEGADAELIETVVATLNAKSGYLRA